MSFSEASERLRPAAGTRRCNLSGVNSVKLMTGRRELVHQVLCEKSATSGKLKSEKKLTLVHGT